MSKNIANNKQGTIRSRNRTVILESAQKLFILHGVKGASVQAIADSAGLAKANVLYYFKTKEKIYHAVLELTLDIWDQGVGEIDINDGPAVAIEKFIAAKVQMSFQYPNASKIYSLEVIQGSLNLREYTRKHLRTWVKNKAKLFQVWIDNGEMANVDPVKLIFLIWSSTQYYADSDSQILRIMNREEYEEEDVIETTNFLTTIILRGCGLIK